MNLQPLDHFTIVRQLNNPFLTDTYYVQAVIRNAYTDVIIDTLNLTDKTGQRFKKDWTVVADPVGLGFYISIVTSVYTDSGYTTKSTDYGDEENTYLVAQRNSNTGGGGGGVSMRDVREVIREEIGKIEFPKFPAIPTPKEYEMRWEEVLGVLSDIKQNIKDKPEAKEDYSPILSKIEEASNGILDEIRNKEVTPATDISPILDKLAEDKDTGEMNHDEMKGLLDDMQNTILDEMPALVKTVLDKTSFMTSFATHVAVDGDLTPRHKKMMQGNMKEANTEPPKVDLSFLKKLTS